MFRDAIDKVNLSSESRANLLNKSRIKYLLSAILSGMYVGVGILLIFTIGGSLSKANLPTVKMSGSFF